MQQQFGKCRKLIYRLNAATGYFEKQPTKYPFAKMPFELKRAAAQNEYLKNQGANEVLESRQKNKKRAFHSGLVPVGVPNVYQGDTYEFVKGQKIKSLIIFHFINMSELVVYFFNRYYIDNRAVRLQRCNEFMAVIKNGLTSLPTHHNNSANIIAEVQR